jgi:Fe-S-cluster containining protein
MKTYFDIKNINITSVRTDEIVSEVPCGTCTLCCQKLSPYLTPDEIASGKYPISLVNPTQEQLNLNPNVGPLVVLYRKKEGGCGMFVDGKCSIYEDRPIACRQFDCRKGHHPSIPNMTLK